MFYTHYGNDFRFSDTGKFHIGKLFWQKYYSETKKKLSGGNGYLRFSYDYCIPFSKPFSFNICYISNQKPIFIEHEITVLHDQILIGLIVDNLPLNLLKLFIFNADFSIQQQSIIENEKRYPSERLDIKKTVSISKFSEESVIYTCLAVNDELIGNMKQLKLNVILNLDELSGLINLIFNQFILNNKNNVHDSAFFDE